MSGMKMGIGKIGSPDLVIKRKFRWILSGEVAGVKLEPTCVKVSRRPCQEDVGLFQEDDFGLFETCYFGTSDSGPESSAINKIAAMMFQPSNVGLYRKTANHWIQRHQNKKYGTLKLELIDGCGVPLEAWHLNGVSLVKVSFSDFDFAQSDVHQIDCAWNFFSCTYENKCAFFSDLKTYGI